MEFFRRKVYLSKYFRPYDSDGDGILDSLILSATTKTLQIPLIQKFDDIGIYRTLDPMAEDVEIIDIDNLWSTSNDGRGDVDYKYLATSTGLTTSIFSAYIVFFTKLQKKQGQSHYIIE